MAFEHDAVRDEQFKSKRKLEIKSPVLYGNSAY